MPIALCCECAAQSCQSVTTRRMVTPHLARGEAWPIAINIAKATTTDCLMIFRYTFRHHSLIAPHKWSHNRPKPIPPTRVLLLCIGRWWSDFRFISCGLLAHFWDLIAMDELIPGRFRGRTGSLLFLDPAILPTNQPLVACVTQQPAGK